MFFIAFTFKGQVHVFAVRVKIVSHSSCRTSSIFKYFCPLLCAISVCQFRSISNESILVPAVIHGTNVSNLPYSAIHSVDYVRINEYDDRIRGIS